MFLIKIYSFILFIGFYQKEWAVWVFLSLHVVLSSILLMPSSRSSFRYSHTSCLCCNFVPCCYTVSYLVTLFFLSNSVRSAVRKIEEESSQLVADIFTRGFLTKMLLYIRMGGPILSVRGSQLGLRCSKEYRSDIF